MWISRVRVVFSFVPPVDNFVDNLLVVIHISTGGILLYELSTGYSQDIHRFINMTKISFSLSCLCAPERLIFWETEKQACILKPVFQYFSVSFSLKKSLAPPPHILSLSCLCAHACELVYLSFLSFFFSFSRALRARLRRAAFASVSNTRCVVER